MTFPRQDISSVQLKNQEISTNTWLPFTPLTSSKCVPIFFFAGKEGICFGLSCLSLPSNCSFLSCFRFHYHQASSLQSSYFAGCLLTCLWVRLPYDQLVHLGWKAQMRCCVLTAPQCGLYSRYTALLTSSHWSINWGGVCPLCHFCN